MLLSLYPPIYNMGKAPFLEEVNTKIKTREGNYSIKPLLPCRYPLTGKL